MILESVFNLFSSALKLIFGWINLPELPAEIQTVVDSLFQYMRAGLGFVFLFFNMDLVKIMLPFVIVVANFEKVYKIVMYVLKE